jgi:hypothetical protein
LTGEERRRQFTASLPMRTALLAVATVWFLGAVWSYTEQSAFAANKGFAFPHLLPLVIDGFAIAMAGVAWAASLDARPAVAARLATVIAVCASSASNGAWAWIRSNQDLVAVLLGVAVPIAANLAFEVLLAELRRQVQRRRGLPPPAAIPYPRLIRLLLAPWRSFVEWRAMVLELTAMERTVAPPATAIPPGTPAPAIQSSAPAPAIPSSAAAALPYAPADAATTAVPARAVPPAPAPSSAPAPVAPTVTARAVEPTAPALPTVERAAPPVPAVEATPAAPTRATAARPTAPETARTTTVPATPRAAAGPVGGTNGHPNGTAAPAGAAPGTNGTNGSGNGNGNGTERRSVDTRVEMLAAHLASTEDAGEFTGEMVGPLLGIEVAPRTGRRLLGQARELVVERARADAEHHDSGLRVIGAG